jgi:8-oxo-dGTP diphosphatase
LATLAYVVDGERVLLIHRNARPEDTHLGKYNGLGGKVETLESPAECVRRELFEEANIRVTAMCLRGTVSWPGFGKHGEDWFGFIYKVTGFAGEVHGSNPEGSLSWEPISRLLGGELPMWEGDRHFLPLVFDDDPRAFDGIMPYQDGRPVAWRYERL